MKNSIYTLCTCVFHFRIARAFFIFARAFCNCCNHQREMTCCLSDGNIQQLFSFSLFFFPFFFLSQNRSYQYSLRTVSSHTESGAPWNDRDMTAETRTWSCIFELNFWLPSTLSTLELINLNSWTCLLENRSFTRWRNFTIRTRMLCQNAFLFKFMFSLGNKETIEKTGLIQ